MKQILITGLNSYVGNQLANWLEKDSNNYKVDKISLRDNRWQDESFSKYDVVVHLAGIVHVKETKKTHNIY